MLARLVQGDLPSTLDSSGRVFIDRDPAHFASILNWLRDGAPSAAAAAAAADAAALAALVARYELPADAAFGLFATARSVGLLAHAMEQLSVAQVIRPRGRYAGPVPGGKATR